MVTDVLQQTKVGVLAPQEDPIDILTKDEAYSLDPRRDPSLQEIFSETPYDSQTHADVLSKSYITSTESLYVRNHAPVPQIDANTHKLMFSSDENLNQSINNNNSERKGEGIHLSLKDLTKLYGEPIEVVSVLQCAGNRQTDDFKASGPNGIVPDLSHFITPYFDPFLLFYVYSFHFFPYFSFRFYWRCLSKITKWYGW